ncbi:MAG: c-type cytochrome [Caldilineaceae bacterium]|nr:c-type cytochrome [Caldilineaceae bacterium]
MRYWTYWPMGRSAQPQHWLSSAILGFMGLLTGCTLSLVPSYSRVADGDPERGVQALRAYGCGACHAIPGVPGAVAYVGPPLDAWAERHYIAGTLVNTPDNLIQWLRDPQAIEPGTAMPNLAVTEQDARDMSAYLYTLRRNTRR